MRFYRDTNPDVAGSGSSPLLHYLQYGRSERRYPTRRRLERDVALVTASGLFDARVYAWDRGRPAQRSLSDIEDYLVGRNHQAPIGGTFDSDFYARAYANTPDDTPLGLTAYAMPILHYIDIGRAQMRVCNGHQLYQQMQTARLRFNERFYLDQFRRRFPEQPPPPDPLEHYILVGRHIEIDPAPGFFRRLLPAALSRHADGRMDPFFHSPRSAIQRAGWAARTSRRSWAGAGWRSTAASRPSWWRAMRRRAPGRRWLD